MAKGRLLRPFTFAPAGGTVVLFGGVMIFGERPSASPAFRAASGRAGRPGPLRWAATLSAVAGTAALWTLAIRLRDSLPAPIPTGSTLDGTPDGRG